MPGAQTGAYGAKTRFAQLIELVQHGETVEIHRHGVPVARLVPMQRSEDPRRVVEMLRLLAIVFEDEGGDYADRLFDHFVAGTTRAPVIWPLEVCNALVSAVRRDRLTVAEARLFFRLIGALPIEIAPALFGRIPASPRTHNQL